MQPWDTIARFLIYGGGFFAIYAIIRTVREVIDGDR